MLRFASCFVLGLVVPFRVLLLFHLCFQHSLDPYICSQSHTDLFASLSSFARVIAYIWNKLLTVDSDFWVALDGGGGDISSSPSVVSTDT